MGSFFASVAVQWWLRRIWDWGGVFGGFLSFLLGVFSLMPHDMQQILISLLQGNWQDLTVKSAIGFFVWAFTQWRSYRATVKPQIVTEDGRQADLGDLPRGNVNVVQEFATTAIEKRGNTLWDMLSKKIKRQ